MTPDDFALLAGIAADALSALGLSDAPLDYARGDALFRQGDASSGLFLIAAGNVRLIGRTPGDGLIELARLGPGEVVGEFSLLDGGVRAATALADSDVRARRIDIDSFAALAVSGDPAALTIMDRLRVDVAERTHDTIRSIAATLAAGAGTPRDVGTSAQLSPGPEDSAKALLHSFPGFDRLSDEEWPELAGQCRQISAQRGTLLGAAGDAADALVIVARGAVRVGVAHPAGGVEQLLIHGPGSFSGAAGMFDGKLTAFVRDVREDAVLLLLDRDVFTALRSGSTALGRKLFVAIGQQMVRDLRRLSRLLGRLRGGMG